MTTKAWFERGRIAAKELKSIREARDVAFAACTGATENTDKLPVQSSGNDSNAIFKYLKLSDRYNAKMKETLDIWGEIETVIEQIDNVGYRVLLRERYIVAKSWGDIAADNHYEQRYLFEVHGKALLAAADKIPQQN